MTYYISHMEPKLPHEDVYTRLGISKIHGIGVIAIKDIPKDTNIFSNDQLGMYWFDQKTVDDAVADKPEMRKYYNDFCVLKDGKYGCPVNFNSMSVGWYINEPSGDYESNVVATSEYDFVALRDIQEGEELFVQYSTFSDHIERY